MAALIAARLLVSAVPLRLWRASLGLDAEARLAPEASPSPGRRLAAHVERAAWRLPGHYKCLPKAAALSWMLRRRRIAHRLAIVVRPPALRQESDEPLHAWIECGGKIILGDLAGPWHKVLQLP